jgi:hypothetical protein
MYIISYDVASKSLAVSIIYINVNWREDLKKINKTYNIELKNNNKSDIVEKCNCINNQLVSIKSLIETLIVPKFFDVVDLIPNKKLRDTTSLLRTSRLKAYLSYMDETLKDIRKKDSFDDQCSISSYNDVCKVLLEYQMGPNDKSRTIGSQILYHYSNIDINIQSQNSNYNIDGLRYNTNVYDIEILGPSLKNKINLDKYKPHSFFMKKYSKSYDANKAHSKSNFLKWVELNDVEHMIKNIKKKNLDDMADSVTMTLAWLHIKSGIL